MDVMYSWMFGSIWLTADSPWLIRIHIIVWMSAIPVTWLTGPVPARSRHFKAPRSHTRVGFKWGHNGAGASGFLLQSLHGKIAERLNSGYSLIQNDVNKLEGASCFSTEARKCVKANPCCFEWVAVKWLLLFEVLVQPQWLRSSSPPVI